MPDVQVWRWHAANRSLTHYIWTEVGDHAHLEHFMDEVFLRSEMVVHCRDVDIGARGDLPQRSACKAMLCEQILGRMQNPLFGIEMTGHNPPCRIKRLF